MANDTSAEEFERIEAHLGDCVECRGRLEALVSATGLVPHDGASSESSVPPSPGLIVALKRVRRQRPGEASPSASVQAIAPGRFGDYELLDEIGHGGMGVVYRARQISLGRTVAVKMISAGELASPSAIQRFRTEAEAAANLDHPNIVPIYEVGEYAGRHFFSMKLVEGQSLAQWLAGGEKELDAPGRVFSTASFPLFSTGGKPAPTHDRGSDPRASARLLATIARAVHHAHQRGVIHRDLKPSNILLDREDQPHLTDFGLAKLLRKEAAMTLSQDVMGTPNYMAPEQAAGRACSVTTAADVFSLGAILYELLTGQRPFQGETVVETLNQVIHAEPTPPQLLNPDVARDLETICLKCLEKEPARRYASAQEVAEELDRYANDEPILARPVGAGERLTRWSRRNPLTAIMGSASLILLLVVLVGSPVALVRIERAREQADKMAAAEAEQRRLAEANLYLADMNLALQALQSDNRGRALALLRKHIPRNSGPDLRGFEWRYCWRQCRSDYAFALGFQSNAVRSVLFSPDSQLVATRTFDGVLKLWELSPPRARFELQRVQTLGGFSADGETLAIGRADGSVSVVEVKTGTETLALERVGQLVQWLAEEHSAATTSSNFVLSLWDMSTRQPRLVLPGPGGAGYYKGAAWGLAAAMTPAGRILAVLERKAPYKGSVWDAASGRRLAEYSFRDHARMHGPLSSVHMSPNEQWVAWTFNDGGVIAVWDWLLATEPKFIAAHDSPVRAVAFSPDSRILATGSSDHRIKLWDLPAGQLLETLNGQENAVRSLGFSPDGRWLVSGGQDETIKVWDRNRLQERTFVTGVVRANNVPPVLFSPDSKTLAVTSASDSLKLLDSVTLEPLEEVPKGYAPHRFSPDGSSLLFADIEGAFQVWDTKLRRPAPSVVAMEADGLEKCAISPDGRLVATVDDGNGIRIRESATGSNFIRFAAHRNRVSALAFSPDGRLLASGGEDQKIRLWDLVSQQNVASFSNHTATVGGLAFSPNGNVLASGSIDKTIMLWDVPRRERLATLEGHRQTVWSVAFSPDGRTLASGSSDGTVKLWSLPSGQEVATLSTAHGSETYSANYAVVVAFSPDGNTLAARTWGGMLYVWRAIPAEEIELATAEPLPRRARQIPNR